jgi:hypothetical protein
MQRMTRDSKQFSNWAPVNFAMVELLPVPVDPTHMMQVPALSSSSGGTTGGRSTRAENKKNQVLAAWILKLYAALSSSSGGTTGGRSTRAENKETQLLAA